jgi:hypothetical protein
MAIQHYKACKMRDLNAAAAKVIGGEKVTPALLGQRLADEEHASGKPAPIRPVRDLSTMNAQMQALGLNYELGDTMMRTGQLGICLINAAPGDFVHFAYLCEKWKERVRPDESEKPDELGDEARDRMGLDK